MGVHINVKNRQRIMVKWNKLGPGNAKLNTDGSWGDAIRNDGGDPVRMAHGGLPGGNLQLMCS